LKQPSTQLEEECPGLREWWPEVESDIEEKKSRRWLFAAQVAVAELQQDAETEEPIAQWIEEGERWMEAERRWREAMRKRRKLHRKSASGWGERQEWSERVQEVKRSVGEVEVAEQRLREWWRPSNKASMTQQQPSNESAARLTQLVTGDSNFFSWEGMMSMASGWPGKKAIWHLEDSK
jgi:hypothetical protein